MKSLPELLVSLALGALVIAGALQMHTALARQGERQKEVAETQESLRISMRLVESALRSAGSAAPVVENDEGQCAGPPRRQAALDWSQGRLRVMASSRGAPILVNGDLHVVGGDASVIGDGDLVQVLTPQGACTREIAGERRADLLPHDPARARTCFDPAPADDHCLAACAAQPCALRRLTGAIEFRVERGRLVTRHGSGPWTVVAENVQELRVEWVCDGSTCDAGSARAAHVTLVARGRSLSELIALRNVS